MSPEPPDFDPQGIWQSQSTEHEPMTIAQVHERAHALQSRVRRRNLIEYIGCAVVIAGFAPVALQRESWMMQAGALLIMAATAFVAWQLHRRSSAQPVPDGGEALVASYRRELIRQRDAIRGAGVWYMAPFAPGMALLMLGRWFQAHAAHRPLGLDHLIIVLSMVIVALVSLVIWLRNQRGADRLQKRIDEL